MDTDERDQRALAIGRLVNRWPKVCRVQYQYRGILWTHLCLNECRNDLGGNYSSFFFLGSSSFVLRRYKTLRRRCSNTICTSSDSDLKRSRNDLAHGSYRRS